MNTHIDDVDLKSLNDEALLAQLKRWPISTYDIDEMRLHHRIDRLSRIPWLFEDESILSEAVSAFDVPDIIYKRKVLATLMEAEDATLTRAIQLLCDRCTVRRPCCGDHR